MARPKKEVEKIAEQFDEVLDKRAIGVSPQTINPKDLFPSGSTLLNLAMSDTPYGGFHRGKINTWPGESSSGKSFCVLTTLAEVANNPDYDDWELVYDDIEQALEFNVVELFGSKLQERLKAPKYDKDGSPIFSNTVQEFKNNILKRTTDKKPFIWVLDSWDALSSDEEVEKSYKEALKAAKSDEHIKELSGSYKTEKAKIGGEILRMIKREIKDTGSVLIIIQQTRQNLNAGLFGKKSVTSGGNAPFFYSTHQLWANKIKTLKDSKTNRIIGQKVKVDVTKNKLTGKKRSVEFDLYDSYGIDDIGSCVDFMVFEGFWTKSGQTIKAKELDIEATKAKLINEIEEKNLEDALREVVGAAWNEIENSIKINRKKKYA